MSDIIKCDQPFLGWLIRKRIYLFTSFSGHRPAQRECARTGLMIRSHAKCHPYPIPQPVKAGHSTGVYDPYSFRIVMWVQWKCCETEATVFRPYPRRLESLNICRCHYKGSTFFSGSLSVGPAGVWSRPPARQTAGLPTELTRLIIFEGKGSVLYNY